MKTKEFVQELSRELLIEAMLFVKKDYVIELLDEFITKRIELAVEKVMSSRAELPEYMTIPEVCERLRVKRHYLSKRRKSGAHIEGVHYVYTGSHIKYLSNQLDSLTTKS